MKVLAFMMQKITGKHCHPVTQFPELHNDFRKCVFISFSQEDFERDYLVCVCCLFICGGYYMRIIDPQLSIYLCTIPRKGFEWW